MKESWEIKKLGDCCNIQTGKLDANARVENGKYPFYTCDSQPYRIDTYAFDAEAILISGNGSLVGHVNYYKGKFNAYQRTYVLTEFSSFYIPYLIHFLKKYIRPYIMKNKKGGCIPYITLPILKNFLIPCPPLPEQESIVAELDCLSGAIEKQKQQLKELDNLAQAIFYDMFGDPITNEKGWENQTLETIISKGAITYHLDGNHGGNYPRNEEFVEYGTPYIGANSIKGGLIDFKMAKYLTKEKVSTLRKGIAKNNDVLFAHNATVGPVALLKTTEDVIILSTSLTAFRCNEHYLSPLFLRAYMSSAWFIPQYSNIMKQSTRNQIPITQQRKMTFIIPPLSLQQEFASKIEAIERQKELIKQSLSETETLFNSRMDYYSN